MSATHQRDLRCQAGQWRLVQALSAPAFQLAWRLWLSSLLILVNNCMRHAVLLLCSHRPRILSVVM